jgi:hypothetical protein
MYMYGNDFNSNKYSHSNVCLADQDIAQQNRKIHVIAGDKNKLTFNNYTCVTDIKN